MEGDMGVTGEQSIKDLLYNKDIKLGHIGTTTVVGVLKKEMLTTHETKMKCFKERSFQFWPETSYALRRTNLKVPEHHCFTVSSVFSKRECEDLIRMTSELGYTSVTAEFDPKYRNNERVMVKSQEFADILWRRIAPIFERRDVFRIIPIGFGNEGTWRPVRLNECIKFSKYLSGTYFLPHIDGPWVPRWDEASIFTVVVYLNDDFLGGETQFLAGDHLVSDEMDSQNILDSVNPTTGTCLIFNHNALHQACRVLRGIKYVARTEVIFQRIDESMQVDSLQFKSNPEYLKMVTLYQASQEQLQAGNPKAFMDLYFESLKLQVEEMKRIMPSIDPITHNILPLDIWIDIFKRLQSKEVESLMSVSKGFYAMLIDGQIWKEKYMERWPTTKFEDFGIHASLTDWYSRYKVACKLHSQSIRGAIDVGSQNIVYVVSYAPHIKSCLSLVDVQSIHIDRSQHYRSDIILTVGKGQKLYDVKERSWKGVARTQSDKIYSECCPNSRVSWILQSPDKPTLFSNWLERVVQSSVCALHAYKIHTGVVFSLGHAGSWMAIVVNSEEKEAYVTQDQAPNLGEFGRRQGQLESIFEYLLQKLLGSELLTLLDQPYQFCCIGGKFDSDALELFSKCCTKKGVKHSVVSSTEERQILPVLGALCLSKGK